MTPVQPPPNDPLAVGQTNPGSTSSLVSSALKAGCFLTLDQVRVGDRVELLTDKTHYLLDHFAGEREGDAPWWQVCAQETPAIKFQCQVLGAQVWGDANTLVPNVMAEGLSMAVRLLETNARMVSREIVQIVWKRGYHGI